MNKRQASQVAKSNETKTDGDLADLQKEFVPDYKDLLQRASFEIRNLRNANQIMAARLEVFDTMTAIFKTSPRNDGMGMAPDLVWEIERRLEESKPIS